ncbi:MAG: GNAT family N-acetyltransferase [Actinomycetales bacterium]
MAPAGVLVRLARPEDVDHVLALYAAVAGEGRWIGRELPIDEDAARARIAEGVDAPGHDSTVAELASIAGEPGADERQEPAFGRLVGQLHLGVAPYGVAELGMLVAAPMRGRGVGRALLDDAIHWARAQPDVHKIALQVWPHNEAAQHLYRTAGFEREGLLRRHYRRRSGELWDAVVMGLQV